MISRIREQNLLKTSSYFRHFLSRAMLYQLAGAFLKRIKLKYSSHFLPPNRLAKAVDWA